MKALDAGAFLALWNSISGPDVQAEYESWHTFEHVPERVGLPGFIEARRYRSLAQPLRYYTCYWLASEGALATPQYRDVFTHPTPWSARMRLHMRGFFRMPCALGGVHGDSSAARMVALHLQSSDGDAGASIDAVLVRLVNEAQVVSAQWGRAQPTDDYPLANQGTPIARGTQNAANGAQYIVMLQHLDDAALHRATQAFLQAVFPQATPVTPPENFELLTQVRQVDLAGPLGTRQPPRNELLATFTSDTPDIEETQGDRT